MPPNGWNCRCTAVQVRRGKYPNIDVAEALALGEEATADDKRGMLRFNPGKLGKTFPDYNPYTLPLPRLRRRQRQSLPRQRNL